jgi:hypothetical protein
MKIDNLLHIALHIMGLLFITHYSTWEVAIGVWVLIIANNLLHHG